jgi:hypothetical protein
VQAALKLCVGMGRRIAIGFVTNPDNEAAFANVAQNGEDFDDLDRLAANQVNSMRTSWSGSRRDGFGNGEQIEIGQISRRFGIVRRGNNGRNGGISPLTTFPNNVTHDEDEQNCRATEHENKALRDLLEKIG